MSTKLRIKKVKTGISGLDKMLEGGFVPGRNILISGPAGSGKTILASHFIWQGVMHEKENCLYITLEESRAKIYEDMKKMGIDFKEMEKSRKFIFVGGPLAELSTYMKKYDARTEDILIEVEEIIKEKKIKRVVVDSINLFTMLADTEKRMRESLAALANTFSKLGCTTLLLSEVAEGELKLSKGAIEEFIADGIVALYRFREGAKFVPGVSVRKMRGTSHDTQVRPLKITNKGIVIFNEETLFADMG